MSDTEDQLTTDNTSTNTQELEKLREHNAKLLAELKAARAELKAAQEEMATVADAKSQAEARVSLALLEQPLQKLCKELSAHPRSFETELRKLVDFRLNDDQEPEIVDKEGKPITWGKEKKALTFNADHIRAWLNTTVPVAEDTASGLLKPIMGGSGSGNFGPVHRPSPRPQQAKPAPNLGLR